jgi:centromeric protein E
LHIKGGKEGIIIMVCGMLMTVSPISNPRIDNVFAPADKNAKVYDSSAKRLVRRVMEGYHGTVFAYGMTGTGKTFAMNGTASSPGIIPLSITDIFSYIRETPHREFLLRVSYLEIYNEKIHDLLSPQGSGIGGMAGPQEEIKLREDSKRGVYATPLKEEIVQSPTQLLRVIARGDHARRTGSTQYNTRSSRSHAVVQIVVESRERTPGAGSISDNKRSGILPGGVRVSTLSLIDLAGSERAAEDKERRTEGAHINKSLLTLGTVIARLSGDKDKNGNPTDKDGKHLPYRDSKLTRLLQPALAGNSLISILCTIQTGSSGSVAAAHSHIGETLNTLKFAARAKNNIVSHAKKAEEALGSGNGDSGSRVLLERYRMEILDLRGQLEGQAKAKVEEVEKEREKEAEQRHGEQMLEMQLARTALKERIEHLNRLILCSKSTGVNSSGTFSSLGMNSRFSGVTAGHISPASARSSITQSTGQRGGSAARTASAGSVSTIGQLPNGHSPPGEHGSEDDSGGEYGDGTATLTAQVRALQADLTDKNRYISTLEKRLLQARRSSHSRTSIGFSPTKAPGLFSDESGVTLILKEKDAEIAELRARLDDKDRMMTALRSAARKRDVADLNVEANHDGKPVEASAPSPVNGGGPVVLLSPRGRKRTKSVDEMSKMLDEMIQDRVESGHLVKGNRGSVRVALDKKQRESISGRLEHDPPRSPLNPITAALPSPTAPPGMI